MKRTLVLTILCMIIILLCHNFVTAAFDKMFLGTARYMGFCGAYVGMSDDEAAVFVNPAGLIKLDASSGIGITGADMYEGLDYGTFFRGNIIGGINFDKIIPTSIGIGSFGFGADYFMVGVDDNVSYYETLYVFSYARKLIPSASFGFNIKIPKWGSDIEGNTDYSMQEFVYSIDLGVMIMEEKNFSIGGVFYDINQPSIKAMESSDDKSGKIPFSGKFGISYRTLKKFMVFNVDVAYKTEYIDLLAGTEVRIGKLLSASLKSLALRGGVYLHEITEGFDFSLGAGYLLNIAKYGLQIDYAFKHSLTSISGTYGTHFLTTTFRYGIAKRHLTTIEQFEVEGRFLEPEKAKPVDELSEEIEDEPAVGEEEIEEEPAVGEEEIEEEPAVGELDEIEEEPAVEELDEIEEEPAVEEEAIEEEPAVEEEAIEE